LLTLNDGLVSIAVVADACLKGEDRDLHDLVHRANQHLATDLASTDRTRHPFHWALEYPEVFLRDLGGFDAVVGNPPFLGGKRITGAMGSAYRNYLVEFLADGVRGSADLVAYFFLKAYRLIREGGNFGLLAVNTIAEGDTRQVGLERLIGELGATIYAAYPNEAWPGKAAVVTSRVHMRKGNWTGESTLNGKTVDQVSAFLSGQDEWTPMRLAANSNKSFQGSIILGLGFTLSEEEALAMIERDHKNKDVLFPYINGKDLNSQPEQKPSRWVINFFDWPEERAKEYPEPYQIVLEKVKPERQVRKKNGEFKKRKPLPQRWWQYADKRPALYHAVGRGEPFESHPRGWSPEKQAMSRVLAISRVTHHLAVEFIAANMVFADRLYIFSEAGPSFFAVLQSSIHEVWARKYSGKLETRLNYSPTDCLETFPLPTSVNVAELNRLGEEYAAHRKSVMQRYGLGLTKLYNRFHDVNDTDSMCQELRDIHREVDQGVADSYGWEDLELEHGFHEVDYLPENDRVRFTISETARLEVLRRLSRLNKKRYEQEQTTNLSKALGAVKNYDIADDREFELDKVAEPKPQGDLF